MSLAWLVSYPTLPPPQQGPEQGGGHCARRCTHTGPQTQSFHTTSSHTRNQGSNRRPSGHITGFQDQPTEAPTGQRQAKCSISKSNYCNGSKHIRQVPIYKTTILTTTSHQSLLEDSWESTRFSFKTGKLRERIRIYPTGLVGNQEQQMKVGLYLEMSFRNEEETRI